MTDRIPLDHLTSDALDQLYDRIATLEAVAAGNKRHVQLIVPDLERAEAIVARIQALADEYPAGIDTALIHEALDTQAALPARCSCTGTNAGLNACTRCPTPWSDIPGANRIRHDDEPRVQLPAAPAPAVTEQAKAMRILYERWVKAGPPPLGTSMSRWWDARLVELHHAIHPPTPAATEATERPHCPCNGVHFPGADNCRWCKCHRTPVPAATDTPGQ